MDNITLFPPGGSPPAPSYVQLGSWIGGEALPDYGAKGLIESVESANALRDGGAFSFRHAPVRKMAFPLLINSPYGVNRLPNPGFETATYSPWSLNQFGVVGTFAVVGNASGAAGSYIALATAAIGSGAPQITATISAVPTNEPMLLAAQFCDFSPSAAVMAARSVLRLRTNGGGVLAPDTAAPGVVFGYGVNGSPNTGNFTNMDIPNTWTRIGGIFSPQAMASLLAGGLPFQLQLSLTNAPTNSAASYAVVGVDEIEWRSAYPQRAIREQESQLREFTTAGAYVSVQPEGVPTSEAVFFDILDGRWEPEYNLYENRAGRRRGTLFLDTQPFGYWPTEILLASSASVGYIGQLAVNGASVIGDVPPLAHISIAPTVASYYVPSTAATSALWSPDMIGVSLAGRPSFQPYLSPASFTGGPTFGTLGPTVLGDKYSPASQALAFTGAAAATSWSLLAYSGGLIGSAIEPAYRGRFRAFALAKLSPAVLPSSSWQLTLDAERFSGGGSVFAAMASSNQIATAYAYVNNALLSASPAYSVLDMGEITLPPAASGLSGGVRLRLWGVAETIASLGWQFSFGGLYLLPVDAAAGILPRGLVVPTLTGRGAISGGTQAAIEWNGRYGETVELTAGFSPSGVPAPVYGDARALYRGVPLRLGATTNQLSLITGDRLAFIIPAAGDALSLVAQANVEYSQVSVSYRPTFQFLAGL